MLGRLAIHGLTLVLLEKELCDEDVIVIVIHECCGRSGSTLLYIAIYTRQSAARRVIKYSSLPEILLKQAVDS